MHHAQTLTKQPNDEIVHEEGKKACVSEVTKEQWLKVPFANAIRSESEVMHPGEHIMGRPQQVKSIDQSIQGDDCQSNIAIGQLWSQSLHLSLKAISEISLWHSPREQGTRAECWSAFGKVLSHDTQSLVFSHWNLVNLPAYIAELILSHFSCWILFQCALLKTLRELLGWFLPHCHLLLQ